MTKQERREVSRLIKGLPEMKSKNDRVRQTVSGETLIARGVKELSNGGIVKAHKTYVTEVPRIVNHRTEAERYFKTSGIEGVKLYCAQIRQRYEDARTRVANAPAAH